VAKAVEAATEHAWHLHNLAVSALERGRGELALVHAFASADAIREEAGDYPRAIRRAYYACQLLGAGPG
jgi:hypothetical protein